MARIKFGAIITEASGSIGGHTIQHSKGGMQIRTKPKPTESFNNLQYQIRRKNPCLQYSWKALSAIQKTVWDRYAVDHDIRQSKGDREILSGHSLWMKYQYYNWNEECNLPVDPATAALLVPYENPYIPPDFRPIVPPVFPPHTTPPDKPVISLCGFLSLCEGQSVSLISSYGDFYLWSTGATTHTITVNTPGIYTVQVGNVGDLWSIPSDPAVVTVGTPPAAPIITVTNYLPGSVDDPNYILLIGEGSYATLTSEIADSYIWSTGEITRSIQVSQTGFYTVRVANAQGCLSSVSRRITVQTYIRPPQPTITPSGPLEFCAGGSVDLESSEAYSYLWSTAETTRTITVSDSGSYTVTIKTNQGYISLPSDPSVVTVNELPAQPVITPSGPTEFCEGGSVDLECSLADSYLWSTTETTRTITVSVAGSYTVQVENAEGCQSIPSEIAEVIVNDIPAQPTITPSGPTEFCEGDSVDLESSVATSYLWYKDAISTGLTTRTINVSIAGSYTVKVTNAGGCQSISSAATVITINNATAQPTITPSGPLSFLDGESVDLESSLADSYLWSTAETTRTITVTESGNYTVQVTNAGECQSIASAATVVTNLGIPEIGDSYGGGKIAYVYQAGDPNYDANHYHGIIAAPSDEYNPEDWCLNYSNTGAYSTAMEASIQMTNLIVADQGGGYYAARVCYDKSLNGYTDWALPTKNALYKLYLNQAIIGGFDNEANYWSSSEYGSVVAWWIYFADGSWYDGDKIQTFYVRAIRYF